MEKREETLLPASPQRKKKQFSFLTFAFGIGFVAFIFGGLFAWAQLKQNETAQNVQNRLPSKTAIVKVIDTQTFRMGDNQKRITLPPLGDQNTTQQDTDDGTNDTNDISDEERNIMDMIAQNRTGPDPSAPFSLYRQPFSKGQKPTLSIVLTDLGLSQSRTSALIENLPEGVSLALSPYAENLSALITSAREDGHEVWLMLPMETAEFPLVDSGPLTLLTDASLEQNKDRAAQLLNRSTGHVGYVAQKNHVFMGEDADINPAIKELLDAGYAVLDSNNSSRSFIANLAYKNDYPHGQNNVWLDEDLTPLAMNQRLRQLMELAEAKGSAIMLMRPYPASIKALQKFLNSAPAQNFDLAPASVALENAG